MTGIRLRLSPVPTDPQPAASVATAAQSFTAFFMRSYSVSLFPLPPGSIIASLYCEFLPENRPYARKGVPVFPPDEDSGVQDRCAPP